MRQATYIYIYTGPQETPATAFTIKKCEWCAYYNLHACWQHCGYRLWTNWANTILTSPTNHICAITTRWTLISISSSFWVTLFWSVLRGEYHRWWCPSLICYFHHYRHQTMPDHFLRWCDSVSCWPCRTSLPWATVWCSAWSMVQISCNLSICH